MKNESLKSLKGIGDKTERLFQKAGICDLEQLLRYYPRAYDCYESPAAIGELKTGAKNAVAGPIERAPEIKTSGRHTLTIVYLRDETGSLQVN